MNEIRIAMIKRTLQRYHDREVPRGPEPSMYEDCEYLVTVVEDLRIELAKERHHRHVAQRAAGSIG